MRSSIACARCRRSKVKCVNSGVNTTCKACDSSGRECVYPVPGTPGIHTGGNSHATQSVTGTGSDGNVVGSSGGGSGGGNRSRPKKPASSSGGHHASEGSGGGNGGRIGHSGGSGGGGSMSVISGHSKSDNSSGSKHKGNSGGSGATASGSGGAYGRTSGASIYGALIEGGGIPAAEDVLNYPALTWQFWTGMHDHFKQHLSSELPFLHVPTFLSQNRLPRLPSQHILPVTAPTAREPVDKTSYPLCLGLLTLTGRFYPPLMKLHLQHSTGHAAAKATGNNPRPADGRKIGEFYAAVLRKHLFGSDTSRYTEIGTPTLEKIQGLLMLAVHEWAGEGKPDTAWLWIGLAGRMAIDLGLGNCNMIKSPSKLPIAVEPHEIVTKDGKSSEERERNGNTASGVAEDEGNSRKRRKLSSSESTNVIPPNHSKELKERIKKELVIQEEISRRTFWSIFMLDRCLSKRSERELIFRLEDINGDRPKWYEDSDGADEEDDDLCGVVRLPCGEQSFVFGEKVHTDVLRVEGEVADDVVAKSNNDVAKKESSIGQAVEKEEGELSKIIRGVEIWGRVRRWRGRRNTKKADQRALPQTFVKLREQISLYISRLPANLTFSPDNINAHIHSKSSTSYAVIHITNFLARMVLHKHILPFIPPPSIKSAPDSSHILESTFEIFKCAKGVFDLVKGLEDWNVMIETPMMGFAIYVAGFWAVYANAFPDLDVSKQLVGGGGANDAGVRSYYVQRAMDTLKKFELRWCLGGGDGKRWLDGLLALEDFFEKAKKLGISEPVDTKKSGIPEVERFMKDFPAFKDMFIELGRDELAGYLVRRQDQPPPPAPVAQASLTPPTASHKESKKRSSPQPAASNSSRSTSGGGDARWIAINSNQSIQSSPPPQRESQAPSSGFVNTMGPPPPAIVYNSPQRDSSKGQQQQQHQQQSYQSSSSSSSSRQQQPLSPPPSRILYYSPGGGEHSSSSPHAQQRLSKSISPDRTENNNNSSTGIPGTPNNRKRQRSPLHTSAPPPVFTSTNATTTNIVPKIGDEQSLVDYNGGSGATAGPGAGGILTPPPPQPATLPQHQQQQNQPPPQPVSDRDIVKQYTQHQLQSSLPPPQTAQQQHHYHGLPQHQQHYKHEKTPSRSEASGQSSGQSSVTNSPNPGGVGGGTGVGGAGSEGSGSPGVTGLGLVGMDVEDRGTGGGGGGRGGMVKIEAMEMGMGMEGMR